MWFRSEEGVARAHAVLYVMSRCSNGTYIAPPPRLSLAHEMPSQPSPERIMKSASMSSALRTA